MAEPLHGLRIVVTRSRDQAQPFCARLAELGAVPLSFPTLKTVAVPAPQLAETLAVPGKYAWLIFTSANAVDFFVEQVPAVAALPPIAVVGTATARRLQDHGLIPAAMPQRFTGVDLAHSLGSLRGKHILLPRSRIGRQEILEELKSQGALMEEITIYDTVRDSPSAAEIAALFPKVDCITFTSPSSVSNFLAAVAEVESHVTDLGLKSILSSASIACIGPTTAEAAASNGLTVGIVAAVYTVEGLVQALIDHYQRKEP